MSCFAMDGYSLGTDWRPIQVNKPIAIMLTGISPRIFVGPVLCRNTKWLIASAMYPKDLFTSIIFLNRWHKWLRPLAMYTVKNIRNTWRYTETAARVVEDALKHPAEEDAVHGIYDALPEDLKTD
jgi:hypothetical protein